MCRRLALMRFFLVGQLVAVSAVLGQNRVTNPDLNLSDDGWSSTSGAVSFAADDADVCGGSGALLGLSEGGAVQHVGAQSSCFVVAEDEQLFFAMKYRTVASTVNMLITYYVDDQCASPAGVNSTYSAGPSPTGFTRIIGTAFTPFGVGGARFVASAAETTPSQFSLTVDRVYAGTAAVLFEDDFEAASICRWVTFP